MSRPFRLLLAAFLGLSAITSASAAEKVPWRQHAFPFGFLFGNDIDSHQQTRLSPDDGTLSGWFYIRRTGVVTLDGYPVATHVDCNAFPDCTVGWTLRGQPRQAPLLYEAMQDLPIFLVPRPDIPQPGSASHFHWLGAQMPVPRQTVPGYLLELTAVDRFCFIHHGAEAASGAASCRDNGGIAIERGIDVASHLNIVPSAPPGF